MKPKSLHKTDPDPKRAGWSKKASPPAFRRLLLFLLILTAGITNLRANWYEFNTKGFYLLDANENWITSYEMSPAFERITMVYAGGADRKAGYYWDNLRNAQLVATLGDNTEVTIATLPWGDQFNVDAQYGKGGIVKTQTYSDGVFRVWAHWYPSARIMQRGLKKLRIEGTWTYGDLGLDGDKASVSCSRDVTIKGLGFPAGTFTRSSDGRIHFNVSGIPVYEGIDKNRRSIYNFCTKTQYDKWISSKGATRDWFGELNVPSTTTSINDVLRKNDGNALSFNNYSTQEIYVVAKSYAYLITGVHSEFYQFLGKYTVLGFADPYGLRLEPDQWSKSISLSWSATTSNKNTNGKWYIYRTPKNGSRVKVTELSVDTRSYTDRSADLKYDTEYTYEITFAPTGWNITAPISDLMSYKTTTITRYFPITVTPTVQTTSIDVTWEYHTGSGTANFDVLRSTDGGKTFTKLTVNPISVTLTNQKGTRTYTDNNVQSTCVSYVYKIETALMGTMFSAVSSPVALMNQTKIKTFNVSKGTYTNIVKVSWRSEQVGSSPTRYVLSRRQLGSDGDYSVIHSIESTGTSLAYDDISASPGQYYEYLLQAYTPCDTTDVFADSETDNGFCVNTGVISGRVSYGTGTAVDSVRLTLTTDSEAKNQFYSLRANSMNSGIIWPLTREKGDQLFIKESKAFTIQMWVCPDTVANDSIIRAPLVETYDHFALHLIRRDKKWGVQARITVKKGTSGFYTTEETPFLIDPNVFTHISFSCDENCNWKVRVVENGKIKTHEWNDRKNHPIYWPSSYPEMAFGRDIPQVSYPFSVFKGYLDEVRVWSRVLTDTEILRTYDRILSGNERYLQLYYPLDEGISNQKVAYDYSKTGDVSNENHGIIQDDSKPSTVVPTADQLSIYGLTDADGSYTITGVPFASGGSSYTITPTMGIHEFSPARQTRFINNNSLNHSGVDFTDISSFPVSGVIYYENTDHPADSVYLYVDGNLASRDGQAIMTDKEGKFEISVPIGKHYITAKRDGHTFVDGGRYPADPDNVGTRLTFDRPIKNLTFYDNTLVPVVGRVVGGEIESKKPLAMGQSVNNIGQAEITLTAGNNYRLNVVRNQDGTTYSIDPNPNNLSVASPTKDVNSTAWRQGGNTDEVCNIVIKTDPKTGEFAALLPPLQYRIKSVKIPSNTEIVFDNLRDIDARDVRRTYTDSVTTAKGEKKSFEYVASSVLTYFATPTFSVTDKAADAGAFGKKTFNYIEPGASPKQKQQVALYTPKPDGSPATYPFGYPIFEQLTTYSFDLKAYETYLNYDEDRTNPVEMKVPLKDVIVTINNTLASDQKVYVEDGTVNGQAVKAGELVELAINQLQLDSLGQATYTWMAGLPNIIAPYTRDLTISFNHNDRDYIWSGYNAHEKLTGIVLGSLPTGSNFITEGPDEVFMILRDPPGSNSQAYWEKGLTETHVTDNAGTFTTTETFTTLTKFGVDVSTITGTPGFGVISNVEATNELEVGIQANYTHTSSTQTTKTLTTTRRISTSDSPDFVGEQGDVFVGASTNVIFGGARAVDITKGQDGQFAVTKQDVISMGTRLETDFMYTTYFIENTLIPNLRKVRNNLLIPVSAAQYGSYVNNTDKPIYITKLAPTDPKFGSSNNDKTVWGAQASTSANMLEGPSYKMLLPANPKGAPADKVHHYNQQVRMWQQQLANNEEAKVKAIIDEPNVLESYSFDAGTTIESSVTEEKDVQHTQLNTFEIIITLGDSWGVDISGTGVLMNLKTETGGGGSFSETHGRTESLTTGFVLADDGTNDALSISTYKAPDNFGAIFAINGGQTSCPYEDAVETKYYRPGTEISKATMRIEIPEITCENPTVTDIPAGKKGIFRLKLANLSEIEKDGWYDLKVIDKTNTNSAVLSLPTGPIGNGRSIFIEGGKTVAMDLTLAQGNTDVLDYENIGIVLVSQCQEDIADTCYVTAHFVPTSSDVTLRIEQTVMNTSTGSILPIVMRDYDANYKNLKALRIQYKGANDVDWRLAQEYVINAADKTNDNLMLPSGGIVNFQFDMSSSGLFPDQTYLFRALAASTYGNGEVTNASQPITVIKDMSKPKPLGEPQPADGVLAVGDEISILFNEDIKASEMTQEKNFIVTGALNECPVDHAVALKMDGAELTAATEADIPLAGKSFAAGMWINLQGAGTLLSHGNAQTKFIVGTDATGCLTLKVGSNTYKSTATIPQNEWVYLAVNYDRTLPGQIQFNASVATAAGTTSLIKDQAVPDYQGRGILRVGLGIKGAISELALWDEARDIPSAIAARIMTKAPSTPHLIGYWKFDEGNGTSAADRSRNRHMTLAKDNWYLNNSNKAVKLDGASYVSLNISTCPTLENDDYAVEIWFKGANQTSEATLFDTGDQSVRMGFNAQGILQLTSKGTTTNVGSKNYLDNRWHHLALNVLRNGNATVYIDGAEALQIPASKVAALNGDAMHIGASRYLNETEQYAWKRYFKGTVDEVRYWKASQSGALLRDNRLTRLSGKDAGLAAYYPFETQELDNFNQVISTGHLGDQSNNKAGLAQQGGNPAFTDEAPALKPVQNPTNLSYSYVASNNKIVLKLEETPAALEGTTVNFTVRDVHDANNNLSDAVRWSAYVKRNALAWSENEVEMSLKTEQGGNFTAEFINGSGSQQTWTLSNLPAWLTVDNSYGTVEPLATKKLRFNISTSVPIGRYDETIYLKDNNGIYMPLALKLTVSGIAPDWNVDIARFESSSNLLARLIINGKPSEDPGDKVGAFVDGECVGVASPMYNRRYDNYFVMMDIYGGTSTSNSNVTFKAYDASTGQIYPVVTPSITVPYTADQFFGKPEAPVILTAENLIEQIQKLNNGWNWISFYVKASDMSVQSVLEGVQTSAVLVKNKTSFALFEDDIWNGKLNLFTNMDMYKLNMNADAELSVIGEKINPTTVPFTINKGWNWIGNTSNANVSVTDAYAGLSPQDGDLVKGQSGFATYDGYEWIGTLKTIVLGRGYMFKSVSDGTRTFTYPTISVSAPRRMAIQERTPRRMEVFTPVSETKYPSNMTMVAQLTEDGNAVVDTEVGVFAGEECRTVETSDAKGILYLTIPGEGTGTPLHFRINHNGQVVTLNCGLIYTDDAMHGSLQNPYLLNLVTAGINGLYGNEGVNIYYVRMTSTLNVDANQVPKRIMIQDIGGRTLYSRTEGLALNNAINLSSFHQGIYIVEVEMPDGRKEVQKILR